MNPDLERLVIEFVSAQTATKAETLTLDTTLFGDLGVDHDLWFLNHQARSFLAHADPRHSLCYHHQRRLVRELFALVPGPLRNKLEWPGPDEPQG